MKNLIKLPVIMLAVVAIILSLFSFISVFAFNVTASPQLNYWAIGLFISSMLIGYFGRKKGLDSEKENPISKGVLILGGAAVAIIFCFCLLIVFAFAPFLIIIPFVVLLVVLIMYKIFLFTRKN